ncbi:hypothetical protein QFZ23_003721 [Arthrobacter globiformis]|nr:hypothetical protein [Arthrobacter globiformis]
MHLAQYRASAAGFLGVLTGPLRVGGFALLRDEIRVQFGAEVGFIARRFVAAGFVTDRFFGNSAGLVWVFGHAPNVMPAALQSRASTGAEDPGQQGTPTGRTGDSQQTVTPLLR